mgnify:CR=1 FL=1
MVVDIAVRVLMNEVCWKCSSRCVLIQSADSPLHAAMLSIALFLLWVIGWVIR